MPQGHSRTASWAAESEGWSLQALRRGPQKSRPPDTSPGELVGTVMLK